MKSLNLLHLCLIVLLFSVGAAGASTADTSLIEAYRQARFDEKKTSDAPTDELFAKRQAKLTASDGANDDNFGFDVAVAGDTAVIGAPRDDIGAQADQGSAYVFVRSSAGVWTFQKKLTASDGAANDSFGSAVAIANASVPSETVIMVGAFGNDAGGVSNKGAVYVFRRATGGTTWTQQQKLTASDGLADDVFGASVAMTGSFAVIGANGDDGTNISQGAAYVFVRNGTIWEQEQKLTRASGEQSENFGWSVDISGTSLIVGTNHQSVSGLGKAVIFSRVTNGNTWVQQTTLTTGGQTFGTSVAINGNTAAVGDFGADVGSNANQGNVNVYTRSGTSWSFIQTLTAADGAAGDEFGRAVAVSGETIVVGAHQDTLGGSNLQGSAYVFKRSGANWIENQKLLDATGAIGDRFGNSVAVSGKTVIVGAWQDDVGALGQAGSVCVFKFTETAVPFDYDGDNKSDISVYRPAASSSWFIQNSTNNSLSSVSFGVVEDKPVPADYDADGKTDIAVWRPSNGGWYRINSSNNTVTAVGFGQNGDIPSPADYDGDEKADICVYRPSSGVWLRLNSSNGQAVSTTFGIAEDKPAVGDFDGDGKADISLYRPSAGSWLRLNSSNGQFVSVSFGTAEDKTVAADYDGDGKTDVAVLRPSNSSWYRINSGDATTTSISFGQTGDKPVAADFDGDGKTDIAVFRPSNSTWFIQRSSAGFVSQVFGTAGDLPTPNAFVY